MTLAWSRALLMFAAISLGSASLGLPANQMSSNPQNLTVIEVTAKKYEFEPSPIRVKQGSKVQLKIRATDHVHGFKISEFVDSDQSRTKPGLVLTSGQDCVRIEKGQTATVEFVAQSPGTYAFRCCVHCGWHHRAMKGQLIVEP